jgi:hypothetical protein
MLYIITVLYEIHITLRKTLCGQNVTFGNAGRSVHKVTIGRQGLN